MELPLSYSYECHLDQHNNKKIPSEMEVAPRYKLLEQLNTVNTVYTVYIVYIVLPFKLLSLLKK